MNYPSVQPTLDAIQDEVNRQIAKWGYQHWPMGNSKDEFYFVSEAAKRATDAAAKRGDLTWYEILREEYYEAFAEESLYNMRTELIQCAAVIVSMIRDLEENYAEQLRSGSESD